MPGGGVTYPLPQMLNFEPLDGLEKFQSRGVCRCWGLRLRRVRGICECEGLLLKISRRVRGQGGAGGGQREGQNPSKILTFEPLAGFKKLKAWVFMGVKACPKGKLGGLGSRGRGNFPPPPKC